MFCLYELFNSIQFNSIQFDLQLQLQILEFRTFISRFFIYFLSYKLKTNVFLQKKLYKINLNYFFYIKKVNNLKVLFLYYFLLLILI